MNVFSINFAGILSHTPGKQIKSLTRNNNEFQGFYKEPLYSDFLFVFIDIKESEIVRINNSQKETQKCADRCLSSHLQSSIKWKGNGLQIILTIRWGH